MSKFLESQKIYFRPYQKKDAVLFSKWSNFLAEPMDLKKELTHAKKKIDCNNVIFIVIDKSNDKAMGLVGLYEIDFIPRKAQIKIALDNNHWTEIYINEVIEMITYYGFDRLNLNRIYLDCDFSSRKSVKFYEKVGFIYECTWRKDIFRAGKYYDKIRSAVLRDDYYKKFYQIHLKKI